LINKRFKKNSLKGHPLIKYLASKKFLFNLGIAAAITIFVLVLFFLILRVYTHHGKAFSVPDLKGMSMDEVESITGKKNLRYEIFDSVYSDEYPPGVVVDQHPEAGFKVKSNRKVFLTTSTKTPEKTLMPNLIGHTLRQARSVMESHGLVAGKLEYVFDIAKNVVLEQKFNGSPVSRGDTLIRGSSIDLVLGKGLGDDKTFIPDLINNKLEDAKIIASDRYLRLGAVVMDNTVETTEDSINAKVWKQVPEATDEPTIPLGSSIDIWLTTDSTKITNNNDTVDFPDYPDEEY